MMDWTRFRCYSRKAAGTPTRNSVRKNITSQADRRRSCGDLSGELLLVSASKARKLFTMDTIGITTSTAATATEGRPTPAEYLARAVDLATENVRDNGGPFGAIVVSADGRVFEGLNRVTANLDPSAHAEVTAIRNA